ncbi:MAG: UDP-3-O-[3-hydroxymyristoyl] N-acetylglucosamine deacetylase [Planctomycetes bacterium]|nr:UDP-3-O-[3-hydroxymyristoyl] N-acetylglucosamine deacetylase [Planctomycetota bacterium]
MKQQTIRKPVEITGRGLFTGERAVMRFKPAKPNTGIVFYLSNGPDPVRIPARVENVSKRDRRTSIRNGTTAIETIEHCLSACTGMGIDNIEVELTGHEVPGLDGSCAPFVEMIQEAEIEPQEAEREVFVIPDTLRVGKGDMELLALPPIPGYEDALEVHYFLDYGDNTPIGRQSYIIRITQQSFVEEIAPARTFVLEAEAEELRRQGLGMHLSYQDLVVFGADGPIENELRFPEECVRHKILDLIGDLTLLGQFVSGRIYARKSGHALNHELVRQLLARRKALRLRKLLADKPVMDIHAIRRILPHRYPFLMVDRVIEIEGTRRAVGVKNVTGNEPCFQGHYPGQPIMPGVLILEALAQMGGILLSQELELKGKVAVLLSIDKVKFRRPVVPGDQLLLEVEALRIKSRTGHVRCKAKVGDVLAAEANLKFMMADADPWQ